MARSKSNNRRSNKTNRKPQAYRTKNQASPATETETPTDGEVLTFDDTKIDPTGDQSQNGDEIHLENTPQTTDEIESNDQLQPADEIESIKDLQTLLLESLMSDDRDSSGSQVTPDDDSLEKPLGCEKDDLVSSLINVQLSEFKGQLDETLIRIEQKYDLLIQRLDHMTRERDESNQISKNGTDNGHTKKSASETKPGKSISSNSESSSGLSWESQKRKMLAEFGMADDLQDESLSEDSQDIACDKIDESEADGESMIKDKSGSDAIYDSIAKLEGAEIDSEIIEQLKEELTGKLREAEVELSINRAKLSQEWANLEQMKSELEQREAALSSKYQTAISSGKPGLLDRFTRHLSTKKS